MACFHPLTAWKSRTTNKPIFNLGASTGEQIKLPCGQCTGCRLERSRQWAIRCMHEASLHDENSFITLTYAPEHLPKNNSLVKRDFQLFMKSLRKFIAPKKVRYYMCGEYGENLQRPHYHAALFGYDFPDKILHTIHNDNRLYKSHILEKIWGKGYCLIGNVTFESAAYIARYVMKKRTGPQAFDHYKVDVDEKTGEIITKEPEYNAMSRRPGLAKGWYEKFKNDVFPGDHVIVNGKPTRPPRYYTQQLEADDPTMHEKIKQRRIEQAKKHEENNTPERLKIRKKILDRKIEKLTRNIEEKNYDS